MLYILKIVRTCTNFILMCAIIFFHDFFRFMTVHLIHARCTCAIYICTIHDYYCNVVVIVKSAEAVIRLVFRSKTYLMIRNDHIIDACV